MNQILIETEIDIGAKPATVWRVFTDPELSRHMGGEYVSDWEAGSALGWKGTDGTLYTRGSILAIEPARLLRHNLYDTDGISVLSVITYLFEAQNNRTVLKATEELSKAVTHEEHLHMLEGWDAALRAVKELAERTETAT